MITITSAVTQALQQDSRDFNVKLLLNGTTNVAGNIRSFKAMKGSCGGEEFNLGVVYCPYITAVIDYEGETVDTLEGVELLAQIGVNTGTLESPNYEMIDLGYFTIIKPQMQGTLAYITAYGRLSTQFNGLYTDDSDKTLAQHLTAISTATGITTTIKGDLDLTGTVGGLDGWSYIEVLQIIAGLCGGYVTEDNAGGIVLASPNAYNESDATRNPAGIYDAHANEFKTLPTLLKDDSVLSGITCFKSIAVDDESAVQFVYGDGFYTYANEYMTQALFDDMTANVGGYTYRAGSLEMSHGTPILEPWDAVRYDSKVVPCMSIEIIFDGGIATNIMAVGKTLADETGGFTGVLSQRVGRAVAKATEAQETADEAKGMAEDTNQYFWHTQTGTDTGAHITEIPQADFIRDPANGGGNMLAKANGLLLRDGLTVLAEFGATGTQIGLDEDAHARITSRQFVLEKDSQKYTEIGIKNGADGTVNIWSSYNAGTATSVSTLYHVVEITSAEYTDGTAVEIAIASDGYGFEITNRQNLGFRVYYDTDSPVPVFTLGERRSTSWGTYSFVEGRENDATSSYAHAEGNNNTASGRASHAEGNTTTASGFNSHAEGYNNTASGGNSHAQGQDTLASGGISHAGGQGTIAQGSTQTVIGRYNVPEGTPDNVVPGDFGFIVGCGTDDSSRANAFGVRYNGDATVKGSVWAGCNDDGSGGAQLRPTDWRDFTFSDITFSAGTIGTRAVQLNTNCQVSGYRPTGFIMRNINDSSAYLPVVFFNDAMTLLYANFYRAKSSAYSHTGVDLKVRVFYEKV